MSKLINHRRESVLPGLWHDFANLFPMLGAAGQDELRADIQAYGVREPVVLFDGRILDGRNRYMAARDLGLDLPVADLDGTNDDALAYVISTNLHRRHLTESQRAAVAAKLANMAHGGDRKSDQAANLQEISQAQAAEAMSVSERSVASAKKVLDRGAPELVEAVEQGTASVSAASAVAELPPEEQAAVVAEGPKAIKAKAKAIRSTKTAPSPDAPTDAPDPHRKGLSSLTREGLEDEVAGLRAENADLRAKARVLRDENQDLKARVKAFENESDLGRNLGQAMRERDKINGRLQETLAELARTKRRALFLGTENEKLRASLEMQEIELK